MASCQEDQIPSNTAGNDVNASNTSNEVQVIFSHLFIKFQPDNVTLILPISQLKSFRHVHVSTEYIMICLT